MGRLQKVADYFNAVRHQEELLARNIEKSIAGYGDLSRLKFCKELPRESFSKFLSNIFQDCSFILNQEQEGEIIRELASNCLHGEIDVEVWKALFSYWTRKDTKPVSIFLAVDVQNDFISGSLALRNCPGKQEGEEVVAVINNIRENFKFDYFGYTKDWHPADHCSFVTNVGKYPLHSSSAISAEEAKVLDEVTYDGECVQKQILWPAHCIQGSYGAELHKDFKVLPSDVEIHKGTNPRIDSYSAFWDNGKLSQTNLLIELLKRNITRVFIGGLATDFCVAFTALDCAEHGFETYIVEEACRGVADESIANMTKKMLDQGVKKITVSEINNYLNA